MSGEPCRFSEKIGWQGWANFLRWPLDMLPRVLGLSFATVVSLWTAEPASAVAEVTAAVTRAGLTLTLNDVLALIAIVLPLVAFELSVWRKSAHSSAAR